MAELAALVLFVCTGNQIRSPLAAAIFQRCLTEIGLENHYRVMSVGTWTVPGRYDAFARKTALRMGLNIEEHFSKLVDKQMLSNADLVIAMEKGQKEGLEVEYPQIRGKIRLLSELAGYLPYDIPDPSGQDLELYLETGEELLKLIKKAFDTICLSVQEKINKRDFVNLIGED